VTQQHVVEAESQQLLRCEQRHTRLIGRAIALSLVAFHARGNEVVRGAFTALCPREDMVERQILGVPMFAAILAPIPVANIDARPFHRRFAIITPDVHIMTQPYHRGHGKRCRWRMEDIIAVIFLNKYRAAKP